jgi:predicted Fe-S protein YdhL (DUF1289 family)
VKKPIKILAALVLCLSLLPLAVYSQESDQGAASEQGREVTREERRAVWESLSEEEKQAKREERRSRHEQRRAEWEAMTPEEREAKRAEMRAKWEAMTPEQREAIKKRRKQLDAHGGRRGDHGSEQGRGE